MLHCKIYPVDGPNRGNALERIDNRIDNSLSFERYFIRGLAQIQTLVGLALAIMTAMALGHVKHGRIDQMRSFPPSPLADALATPRLNHAA